MNFGIYLEKMTDGFGKDLVTYNPKLILITTIPNIIQNFLVVEVFWE